jgi:protein-tyrosine-phosphatase
MHSILFVCTANICRSPMAMGLMQARVGEGNPDWKIESAGTWALEGDPPADKSVELLLRRGIDIDGHRSCPVEGKLLDGFKLILTMEKGHKEALQVEYPRAAARVFMLSEMTGQSFDIPDPVGRKLAAFEQTAGLIDEVLDEGFERIEELSRE